MKKIVFASLLLIVFSCQRKTVSQGRAAGSIPLPQAIQAEKSPVILNGDLNSVAASEPINLLDTQFKRTCINECPGTIPVNKPHRTIDYIATRNVTWPLLSYEVIPETYASDHRPIIAVFKTANP